MIKPLIAGNWKMNGTAASLDELKAMSAGLDADALAKADALICPPSTLLERACVAVADSGLMIGAQDCHSNMSGAHTGDVSAEMVKDCGAGAVIVGHSERRADHHETDDVVRAKAEAAIEQGLLAIVCVGETEAERRAGQAVDVVSKQVRGSWPKEGHARTCVIAYEPVWAIGTGLTPTTDDVADIHAAIRSVLAELSPEDADVIRILYGGSVKPGNAAELLSVPNVNGALIGGASLKAADFLAIHSAA